MPVILKEGLKCLKNNFFFGAEPTSILFWILCRLHSKVHSIYSTSWKSTRIEGKKSFCQNRLLKCECVASLWKQWEMQFFGSCEKKDRKGSLVEKYFLYSFIFFPTILQLTIQFCYLISCKQYIWIIRKVNFTGKVFRQNSLDFWFFKKWHWLETGLE